MKTTHPFVERDVLDNSIVETHQRCPRLALYQYFLNRSPSGDNYSIGFGIAYHKYREVLEDEWMLATEAGAEIKDTDVAEKCHNSALATALVEFGEGPPPGHRKEYLNRGRLIETCNKAFERWKREKVSGDIVVLETEQAFTLPLPFGGYHGGRFDQIIEWNGALWARDFKTTSRMGASYARQFDPNNQMSGYVWAVRELSGRKVRGVRIDVVYNTKTKGPEFHPFLSTRTDGQIEQWLATQEREREEIKRNVEDFPEKGFLAFPQRTSSCNDYGGCYFRDACKLSSGRQIDNWLEDLTVESVWDFTNPDDEEGTPE